MSIVQDLATSSGADTHCKQISIYTLPHTALLRPCIGHAAILVAAIKWSINTRMVDLTARPAADKPSLLRPSANIFLPSSAYSIWERPFAGKWVRLLRRSSCSRIFLTPAVMSAGYRKILSYIRLNLMQCEAVWFGPVDLLFMETVFADWWWAAAPNYFYIFFLTLPVRTCRVNCSPFFSQLFTSSFAWRTPPSSLTLSHFNSNQSPSSAALPVLLKTEASLFFEVNLCCKDDSEKI